MEQHVLFRYHNKMEHVETDKTSGSHTGFPALKENPNACAKLSEVYPFL